jgi:hypothetical protein
VDFRYIERLAKLDVKNTLKKVLNKKKVQDYLINLNTEIQLFEEGVDVFGVSLFQKRPYTPFTQKIKLSKGQPSKRVTLKDTGDYYKTFRVLVESNGDFKIQSDPIKDGRSLFDKWDNVEGLTESNRKKALIFLEKEFWDEVLR